MLLVFYIENSPFLGCSSTEAHSFFLVLASAPPVVVTAAFSSMQEILRASIQQYSLLTSASGLESIQQPSL